MRPAIPVTYALPLLDVLAGGVRLRADEREALEVVLSYTRQQVGLDQVCRTCSADVGELCIDREGRPLRGGTTHATRRTLDLMAASHG